MNSSVVSRRIVVALGKTKSTADRIRDLRKKNGWTRRDLGDRLGISERAVSFYEDGARQPSPNRLQRLLDLELDPEAEAPGVPSLGSLRAEMDQRFTSLERQIAELRGMILAFHARIGGNRG